MKNEYGRFQLIEIDGDKVEIFIENVNRDSDHWLAVKPPRGRDIIGHIKLTRIAEGVFQLSDLRPARDPLFHLPIGDPHD